MGYTLRDGRYRYTKWLTTNRYRDGNGERKVVGAELYDYEVDPIETANLATNPEYTDVVKNFDLLFRERYNI